MTCWCITAGTSDLPSRPQLLVDDLLVYNGQLGQIAGGPSRLVGQPVPYHTVLFTADRELVQRERNTVIR